MNRNVKTILSTMLVFALVAGCFAVMPLNVNADTNIMENDNQDFSGTIVCVEAPTSVNVGDGTFITVSVENVADRGLPEVSIWVNGSQIALYDVAKGATVTRILPVDTSVAGSQTFAIEVWTRIDNKNFQYLLGEDEITINVVEKIKTPQQWINGITDAINEAIAEKGGNIADLVVQGANDSTITLTIDGVERIFTGGKGVNSDKTLVIDGRLYTITIQANGARFTVV
jgi:hypothetical protein